MAGFYTLTRGLQVVGNDDGPPVFAGPPRHLAHDITYAGFFVIEVA
ncbi:MAG: hypothetical protein ABI760_08905 [Ferruginibacter sp.]